MIEQPAIQKRVPTLKHRPVRLWRLVTAFCSLMLLCFICWKGYQIYHLSPDAIYARSFQPYDIYSMGSDSLSRIEKLYVQDSCGAAIKLTKKATSLTEREKLTIGMCFLKTEDYLSAISWFGRNLTAGNDKIKRAAEYYLTLTHIKNRDYDRAIELMQFMVNNKAHPYHRQFSADDIRQLQLLKWK